MWAPPRSGRPPGLRHGRFTSITFNQRSHRVIIRAPHPAQVLATLQQFGGIPVPSGQFVHAKRRAIPAIVRYHILHGILVMEVPPAILKVTAEDASGNQDMLSVTPHGPLD